MKRILFLTQGDLQTQSSRHRVYQFLPILDKAGYEYEVHPAVKKEEHHEAFLQRSLKGDVGRMFRTFTRRVKDLHQARDFDAVFVQKPILPAPLFNMELRIAREGRLIFDFDDAVFLKRPAGSWLASFWPQNKRIGTICKNSFRVSVGNRQLADFVRRDGVEPVMLPTVVDTDAFEKGVATVKKHSQKIPVIGWVGSPSTQSDLDLVLPSLIDLHSRVPFVVRIIGGVTSSLPVRFPIEWKPWKLESEIADIAHLDYGLAPMQNTEWNRGKSGLKVLQYWAAGVPVVASPVGIYRDLIREGENGVFATTPTDWAEKLLMLMKTPDLRRKIVEGGRRSVLNDYSLNSVASKFLTLFDEPMKTKPVSEEVSV
jgi:glycosyltransferase involved in cell wall biosynthesis